ncbi:MAG: hypothetical protein FOGNACKC_04503 [Anaerolineae bacterium]|nr:hypothetical protein [Anaerolineae bacterium]
MNAAKLRQFGIALALGTILPLVLLFGLSAGPAQGAPLLQAPVLSVSKQGASNWSQRVKLTFTGTVTTTLTDFPVLVVLNSSRINYAQTRPNGEDIRFVDPSGNPLNYEIEAWNPGGSSYVWVKVPQIVSAADFIWLYYGNPTAPDAQNPAAVWTNNFSGVWHMDASFRDSSPFHNDGQSIRPPTTTAAGRIASAQNYTTDLVYINVGSNASVDDTFSGSGGTLSAWIRPSNWGKNNYGRIADKSTNVDATDGWGIQLDSPGRTLRFERDYSISQGAWLAADDAIQLNNWQHITLVYQDGVANQPLMYINGVPVTVQLANTPSGSIQSDANQDLWLGNFSGSLNNTANDRAFEGIIDEVRLARGQRPADWNLAEYRSTTDTLLRYDPPENVNSTAGGVVGAPFTYTLTVSNTGNQAATGVVVSDTVPAGANYVSGGSYTAGSNTVTWTVPSILQQSAQAVTYVVTTCQLSLYNDGYQVVASNEGATSAPGAPVFSLLTPPSLTAAFAHSTVILGQSTFFTSTSTTNGGPIVSRSWNFGNGQSATGSFASTTFNSPGVYTVTLTVTDTCGYVNSASQPLTASLPVLNLSKTAQPQPPAIGSRLTYTLVVTNSGLGTATGVTISDTLAINGQLDTGSMVISPPAAGGSTGAPPQIARGITVDPGAAVTVTYAVTVTDGPTLANTAAVTSTQTPSPVTAGATIPVAFPDVTINKTVTPTVAVPGQTITYTLIYTNLGPGLAKNVIITDPVPITLTGVVSSFSGALLTPLPGPNFSWQAATLSPGSGGQITLVGQVDPLLQADTAFTNTAQITNNFEAGSAPNSSSVGVTVSLPRASFSAATYLVSEAAGAAVITVNLSIAPRTPVSVTYTASSGTATAGSDFTPVSGQLTFSPGTTLLTFTVPITNDIIDEPNETVLLALSAPHGVILASPQNGVLTIIDDDAVQLGLSKTGQPALVRAGQRLTYTIVVSNAGNAPATAGILSDAIPAGTQFIASSLSIQPQSAGSPGSLPALVTNLSVAPGGRVTVTFAVTVTIPATNGAILTNTATVTSSESLLPLTTVATNTVLAIPAVSVQKSGPATATVGSQLNYIFTVTNPGDTLLQIQSVTDNRAGPGVFSGGDSNSNSRLDPGEAWQYTGSYTVLPTDASPITNTVTVTATSPTGIQVTASSQHSTSLDYAPVLALTKTGPISATVGQQVVFTFTLSHAPTSDGSPVHAVSVIDNYAGPAALVSNGNGNSLLELGETWVYTAAYIIKPTNPNPLTNTGLAIGRDGNNKLVTASAQHVTNLSGFDPSLFVDKDGPVSAQVGDTAIFTFTVINVNLLAVQLYNLGSISIAAVGDGSPINMTSVTDSVAGPGTYVSGDFNNNGRLDGAEAWVYTAAYVIPATGADTLTNTAIALGLDQDGQQVSASDVHLTDIIYSPQLQLVRTGPTTATVAQTLNFTYTVSHAPASDGSAVGSLSVTNSLAGAAALLPGGDVNSNSRLDSGETWVYTASYTVRFIDPKQLVNTTTVQGRNTDGNLVIAQDSYTIVVDKSGASGGFIYYFPLIFKN